MLCVTGSTFWMEGGVDTIPVWDNAAFDLDYRKPGGSGPGLTHVSHSMDGGWKGSCWLLSPHTWEIKIGLDWPQVEHDIRTLWEGGLLYIMLYILYIIYNWFCLIFLSDFVIFWTSMAVSISTLVFFKKNFFGWGGGGVCLFLIFYFFWFWINLRVIIVYNAGLCWIGVLLNG